MSYDAGPNEGGAVRHNLLNTGVSAFSWGEECMKTKTYPILNPSKKVRQAGAIDDNFGQWRRIGNAGQS